MISLLAQKARAEGMLAVQTLGAKSPAAIDTAQALGRVLDLFSVSNPARLLMLVEDPGAANFAAGLLPALASHGPVAVYARGPGGTQLARLGVNALPLAEPFDAATLLALIKPTLALVGTSEEPDAAAHDLVAACRQAHVPTLGFVDGPANIEGRFRGPGESPLSFAPDAVFVPMTRSWTQLVATGFPSDHAFVVTHPHFERLAEEKRRLDVVGRDALRRRLFPICPEGRPVLVFLAERSGGLDATSLRRNADYMLAGRGRESRRTNIVLEEVLDALAPLNPRPFVVLRLHPKNEPEEFTAYADEIDQLSRDEPALDVVYAADAVVGLTTILLSEAALLRRPVLSVVPRPSEREWLLIPPQGDFPCLWERQKMIPALKQLLKPQS